MGHPPLFKRTTFIVEDAARSKRFYERVFGYRPWYDNELDVDGRFPPAAPHGARAHLVILQVDDPKIGMLGFLSYLDDELPLARPRGERRRLRIGDPILVIESDDIDALHERALAEGAEVLSPPTDWEVPGRVSETPILLRTLSMLDPDGIYLEIGQKR